MKKIIRKLKRNESPTLAAFKANRANLKNIKIIN